MMASLVAFVTYFLIRTVLASLMTVGMAERFFALFYAPRRAHIILGFMTILKSFLAALLTALICHAAFGIASESPWTITMPALIAAAIIASLRVAISFESGEVFEWAAIAALISLAAAYWGLSLGLRFELSA